MKKFKILILFCWISISSVNCMVVKSKMIKNKTLTDVNENPATSIIQFWREQEKLFELGTKKEVALVLGNTGSGKSATSLFLVGANLKAAETYPGSKQYLIVDEAGKIGNSTSKSKTLIPESMTDSVSGTVFFDCPGFMDTRPPKFEITIAYFLNKLFNFMMRFKLVFVANYSWVTIGEDRSSFMKLIEQSLAVIKNFEKFSNGIAMVVTKAVGSDDDNAIIRNVAHFLLELKEELKADINDDDTPEDERQFKKRAIKFVEILLTKQNDEYSRIGIFRRPHEAGPLNDMEIFKKEKKHLDEMINKSIDYVPKGDVEFGYAISDKTKLHIKSVIDTIVETDLVVDVLSICDEIEQFYLQQEKQIGDMITLHAKLETGHKTLSKIETDDTRLFVQLIVDAVNILEIGVPSVTLDRISKHIEYIDFLMKITTQTLTNPLQLANKLKITIDQIESSRKWYNFLIDLHTELSKSYSQGEDTKAAAIKLQKNCLIGENDMKKVDEIGLKSFLDTTNIKSYSKVEKLQVNSFELKALHAVLTISFDYKITHTCTNDKKNLTVTGYNVRIGDAMDVECWKTATTIEILALNNLVFNKDIDQTGKEATISVIAPTWEIAGDRTINLNGTAGKSFESKAPDGKGNSESAGNGSHGTAGGSGGPGGIFLGIGNEFINGHSLKIQAHGGFGGKGQDGGNGS